MLTCTGQQRADHPKQFAHLATGPLAMLQVEFRGLGSGGFSSSGSGGFTSSTAFPPRSATHSPTPSARSGNPFQEFYEQGGAQEAGDKATAGLDKASAGLSEADPASGQSMGIQNWPSQGSMGGGEHSGLWRLVGESASCMARPLPDH